MPDNSIGIASERAQAYDGEALRQAALTGPGPDTPPGWPQPEGWRAPLRLAAGDAAGFLEATRALPARHLYLLIWESLHLRTVQRWCRHHSEGRRWLPTGGGEWGLMASVRDPTAAFHILRLMGGGLRRAAKRHPWQARLPGACHGCGHAVQAICWTTRTQTHQGLG